LKNGNLINYDLAQIQLSFMEFCFGTNNSDLQLKLSGSTELKGVFSTVQTYEGMKKYFSREFEEAKIIFANMESRAMETFGLVIYYDRYFYHILTLIQVYNTNRDEKDLEKLNALLVEYESFVNLGKKFFLPKYKIMQTYLESIKENSDYISIISKFEESIALCQKYSMIIPSAVCSTLLLRFVINNKLPTSICQMYYDDTISILETIQAKGLINNLKLEFPSFANKSKSNISNTTTTTRFTTSTTSSENSNYAFDESLDMMSIVKASQALSVELSLSNLISQVMRIILENVGAERGLLMMIDKEQLVVKSIADSSKVTLANENVKNFKDICCYTLIDIVKATKKEIILENASTSSYSQNTYILNNKSKSILVHPILKGKNLIGIIYLENNSIEGTFVNHRKIVLGYISSQLAISYENATLYEEVNSLNKAYERFLPKEFLNQLGKGDVTKIKKGDSTTKKMSILFSDIRGFTNLTEKMNSEESFSFVNDILSQLAPIISKNNGFIDKFLGDCIMALFPYQVDDAVKCGLELTEALENYNNTQRKGLPPVNMGIGINYGSVMIGTLGAEERLDGTVISDAVNVASRVESLTKTLGATFVVTKEVIDNLSHKYSNRCIGKFLLKGKDFPMTLYQILNSSSTLDVNNFNLGLMEFSSQNFKKAKKIFEKVQDATSNYLVHVCEIYDGYTFSDEWSGEIKIDKDGNPEKLENETLVQKKVKELTKEEKITLYDELSMGNKEEFLPLISSKFSDYIDNFISKKK
jgi:class 3 adenylate cyclase